MKAFIYNGLRIAPKRKFTKKEEYEKLGLKLPLLSMGVSNYEFKPTDVAWDYVEFYKVAKENGCGDIDVFICKGVEVVPGTNELYHLKYNNNETYNEIPTSVLYSEQMVNGAIIAIKITDTTIIHDEDILEPIAHNLLNQIYEGKLLDLNTNKIFGEWKVKYLK